MNVEFRLIDEEELPPLVISMNENDEPKVVINSHHRIWMSLHRRTIAGVVDALQEEEGNDTNCDCEEKPCPTEEEVYPEEVSGLDEVVPKHVVLDREEGLSLALEQVKLNLPCADILSGDGGKPEAVDSLVIASRGTVFWRGHLQVVAVIVFNEEVHV